MDMAQIKDIVKSTPDASINEWKKGSVTRHYINMTGMVSKLWFADDKVHFSVGKGRNSNAANTLIETIIGCNITDRYSKAPEYVVNH